jgi:hypothetical protein
MSSFALSGSAVYGGASAAAIIQSAVAGSGLAVDSASASASAIADSGSFVAESGSFVADSAPLYTASAVLATPAPTLTAATTLVAATPAPAPIAAALPLEQYQLNVDPSPEVIRKKPTEKVQYTQEISLKFLKPPPPEQPGDIVIKQERDVQAAPAPPLLVRQKPPAPLGNLFKILDFFWRESLLLNNTMIEVLRK